MSIEGRYLWLGRKQELLMPRLKLLIKSSQKF